MTRLIALALTVLTGFSGLVYEVTWQKYLASLLGSHSEAVAAVLAIYLGGLAAGYALFGRVTRRAVVAATERGERPRLLRLYGRVEAGIGLYALVFPFVFTAAQALSVRLPHTGESVAFTIDVALTILLIAPPTILMGGTIPVLTQALSEKLAEATRVHAWIYACNTAGAFFGALAGAFVLIPWLGLDGVMRAMGAVNLFAGVAFLLLERRPVSEEPTSVPGEAVAAPEHLRAYAVVVLLAGFAMMCVQTVLNRIGALSLGASHFTFAMVVAVFVLCIALGSFAVSAARRIPPLAIVLSQWLMIALLLVLYTELENATYYAHVVRSLFESVPQNFYPFHLAIFLCMGVVLLVPIGLSGALLPLVFHHLRNQLGGIGGIAGQLYAWNTLGSLLGALLGGYALLFVVDLHDVFAIALAALLIGTGVLTVLVMKTRPAVPVVVVMVSLLFCALLPRWDPERMSAGLFRRREASARTFVGPDAFFPRYGTGVEILFYDDDPTSTVTVTERLGQSRSIITNGKSDGNTDTDYATMALAGLIPAMFTDDSSRAFVIGWGLGVTAGVLGALDSVDEVVAAEISPAVLEAAPLFDATTQRASANPKIQMIRSDAYRALLRSDERFGVIASEPSNPWVMGVEMLFSQEFLEAARDRLTPGGVYAQWIHTYSMDASTLAIVLRTYKEVFGDMAIWFTQGPDIILLGFKDPSRFPDVETLRRRFDQEDLRSEFGRAGVGSLLALSAHELVPLGAVGASRMWGPVHTIRHPILSDGAARAFFVGRQAVVPRMMKVDAVRAGARHSLLRQLVAENGANEDVLEELTRQVCFTGRKRDCSTMLARWAASFPDSGRLGVAHGEIASSTGKYSADGRHPAESPDTLNAMALMFLGQPAADPKSPGPLADAVYTTDLYRLHFHHGFPFPRQVLTKAWRRCRGAACSPAYERAVRAVGPVDGIDRRRSVVENPGGA